MRSLTTTILLAAAIGLGVGIYWVEFRQTPGQDNEGGNVLTRFQPESVVEIRIDSDGIETVITKQKDLWFFEKPVADRADQATTAAVLDLLSHLTIRDEYTAEEIKADSSLSDEKTGLTTENKIQITLTTSAGDKKNNDAKSKEIIVLTFGKVTPMSNTLYARIESDTKKSDAVYIVDGSPQKYFEDPATALRDQSLLYAPENRISGLTVKTALNTIKMERKLNAADTGWLMVKPLSARANSELIETIIAQLSSLRVESLLESDSTSGANPNPVPEDGVVIELQLLGQDKPVSVFLSPAKTTNPPETDKKAPPLLEAQTSDRPATFLIRSSLLKQLPTSPNSFRDPHLARIPANRLHSIFIQTRGNPDVILTAIPSSNGPPKWKSLRNGKREDANDRKITALVDAVNNERILGFVSDLKADPALYGLDQPFTAVTFNVFQPTPQASVSKSGEAPKAKMIQRTLKLGISKDDPNALFANFVGKPYIYQIPPTFRNRVSPHPLKWKDPKVLSFSVFSLRQIERTIKDQETLQLAYDFNSDIWSGKQKGDDISGRIDARVAMQLKSILGSLTAEDWITTSQLAYKALSDPTLTFKIVIEEIDRALQEPKEVSHTLKFSPTTSNGLYYGSFDNSPDVFIIGRETYRDLIEPILQSGQ